MTVGAGLLNFLGGEEYPKSIADIFGMSLKSAERIIDNFLNAANNNLSFDIYIPLSNEDLQKCAQGFDFIRSAYGMYYDCVGVLDGWLCCIQKPSVTIATGDFSGHYHRFGKNVQTMCDSNL